MATTRAITPSSQPDALIESIGARAAAAAAPRETLSVTVRAAVCWARRAVRWTNSPVAMATKMAAIPVNGSMTSRMSAAMTLVSTPAVIVSARADTPSLVESMSDARWVMDEAPRWR